LGFGIWDLGFSIWDIPKGCYQHPHSDIEKLLKIPYVLFLIHYECPVKIKISAWGLHLPINGHPSNEAIVLWRLKYLYDT
jgi:hypothetical protein